jgi:GNAT superfamily N-acetyltransferase
MHIQIKTDHSPEPGQVIALYKANHWSSAEKPELLLRGLNNSHSLVTAWDGERLVGLGNALSDGFLVVYYPHLLVLPDYQGKGVGRMIMDKLQEKYADYHQQILVADGKAIDFYGKCGFEKASDTQAMWIYQGNDH